MQFFCATNRYIYRYQNFLLSFLVFPILHSQCFLSHIPYVNLVFLAPLFLSLISNVFGPRFADGILQINARCPIWFYGQEGIPDTHFFGLKKMVYQYYSVVRGLYQVSSMHRCIELIFLRLNCWHAFNSTCCVENGCQLKMPA